MSILDVDSKCSQATTTHMVSEAIGKTKSTYYTGPDGISNLRPKYLDTQIIRALKDILNFSITYSKILTSCKLYKIVPILKSNKPPRKSASYRPISLLSNPSITLEKLILLSITPHTHSPQPNTASVPTISQTLSSHRVEGLTKVYCCNKCSENRLCWV